MHGKSTTYDYMMKQYRDLGVLQAELTVGKLVNANAAGGAGTKVYVLNDSGDETSLAKGGVTALKKDKVSLKVQPNGNIIITFGNNILWETTGGDAKTQPQLYLKGGNLQVIEQLFDDKNVASGSKIWWQSYSSTVSECAGSTSGIAELTEEGKAIMNLCTF
jgi:hypothetical protein